MSYKNMTNERYIDRVLDKFQRSEIINHFNEGMSQREIAKEMNIGLDYVIDVIDEQESKIPDEDMMGQAMPTDEEMEAQAVDLAIDREQEWDRFGI